MLAKISCVNFKEEDYEGIQPDSSQKPVDFEPVKRELFAPEVSKQQDLPYTNTIVSIETV